VKKKKNREATLTVADKKKKKKTNKTVSKGWCSKLGLIIETVMRCLCFPC
jgi:hypothetical protein